MADGAHSTEILSAATALAERYFAASDLAGLRGLPGTARRVREMAKREHWEARARVGSGGGKVYPFSALPAATQAALLLRAQAAGAAPVAVEPQPTWTEARLAAAADAFQRATAHRREIAQQRVTALQAVAALVAGGAKVGDARQAVAGQLACDGARGFSAAQLARFARQVEGAPGSAWAAILLPQWLGRTATATCDEAAWSWYKQQWLTRNGPSHEDTYRRLCELAAVEGWKVPSARTLVRRCERELSAYTVTFYRRGAAAAARMLPPMKRDSLVFAAGEAVNGDGLKFDTLATVFPDGEIVTTATAWFWQDIRSRRILAFRLGKTENTDIFRLATYDLTKICAPAHAWMDNTRVAANKLMTAGAEGRHRYHDKPSDGMGALLQLGIEPHFTNPDKELGSPGAKPIERAFGIGGIHGMVRANPRFRDRGFSKATAVGAAELREVIAEEVARFNARRGRRTQACGGVLSFDEAWAEGLKQRPPRILPESQRQLLLMSREVVRADARSGIVTLKAGRNDLGTNSYWCEEMHRYLGRQLIAMFDPENLAAGIHLYQLDGTYLLAVPHRPSEAYNSVDAGREHQRRKARILKEKKRIAAEERGLDEHRRRNARTVVPPPATPEQQAVVEARFQKVFNPDRDAKRAAKRDGWEQVSNLDNLMLKQSLALNDDPTIRRDP